MIQLPGTTDVLVVGFQVVGGTYMRSMTKLSLTTGVEAWTSTSFGDTAGPYELEA